MVFQLYVLRRHSLHNGFCFTSKCFKCIMFPACLELVIFWVFLKEISYDGLVFQAFNSMFLKNYACITEILSPFCSAYASSMENGFNMSSTHFYQVIFWHYFGISVILCLVNPAKSYYHST